MLSKEKEKDKSRSSSVKLGLSSNDYMRIHENKIHDWPRKCLKGHKRIPANLIQVIDFLEIILKYPAPKNPENGTGYSIEIEVDRPTIKVKGKSKVDETKKIKLDSLFKRSARLARVTFVVKLSSNILLMYVHSVGGYIKKGSRNASTPRIQLSKYS